MRPQTTCSNPLSGSITCLSSAGLFAIFVFVLISSVGVQRCDAFIISNIDSLGQKKRVENGLGLNQYWQGERIRCWNEHHNSRFVNIPLCTITYLGRVLIKILRLNCINYYKWKCLTTDLKVCTIINKDL